MLATRDAKSLLQHAVEASFKSTHPDKRFHIGAALYTGSTDNFDESHIFSASSGISTRLSSVISHGDTISGHGPTTHAEMRLLHHHSGKALAITDPPCPDCMNGITLSNVDNIIILNQGFHNAWFEHNHSYFMEHSLPIAQQAGIRLFTMGLNDQEPYEIPAGPQSPKLTRRRFENIAFPDNTIDLLPAEELLQHAIFLGRTSSLGSNFNGAIAIGRNKQQTLTALSAVSDLPPGMTTDTATNIEQNLDRLKYMLPVHAVKGLLIRAPSADVSLTGGTIYSRYLPPANILIDCVDSGVERLFFTDLHSADPYDYPHSRTECAHSNPSVHDAIECMNFLTEKKLMEITHIPIPE